jgi:hypothetical protein
MEISKETQGKINDLIAYGFKLNRTWDNFLGWSNWKWAMSGFNKVYHAGLAHLYPLLSDKFAEILEKYNERPLYADTPADFREYADPLEFFEENLTEQLELYHMVRDAIAMAEIKQDYNAKVELDQLLRLVNKFVDQAILLRDKMQSYIALYGEGVKSIAEFDEDCGDFYIGLDKEF